MKRTILVVTSFLFLGFAALAYDRFANVSAIFALAAACLFFDTLLSSNWK